MEAGSAGDPQQDHEQVHGAEARQGQQIQVCTLESFFILET